VHADVFEPTLAMRDGLLPLPVGAQGFIRAARANAEFEHRVERAVGLLEVGGDDANGFVGGGVGKTCAAKKSDRLRVRRIDFCF